ncbi:unnamed protein product [Clonostachys solani]|uniref:Uncharacterized protein n=1 Tax=Clonostachys solani TaxID=160281 RepID=A0A9P0EEG0_9HYPO|nr:unnamed protein product [Clonostachys solani]
MAPNLDTLPMEILLRIAEMSTWGVSPSSEKAHPATYARNHASLARTCRWLYETLNGKLYKRNLKNDQVTESCLLWAVDVGNLDTVKRAVAHGANLDMQVEVHKETAYCPPWGTLPLDPESPWRPPTYPWSFSLLHLAVGRQHVKIVQYLLEKNVDVHAPALNFYRNSRPFGVAPLYPLHLCLFGIETPWHPLEGANQPFNNKSAFELVELLVTNGAFLVAEGVSAIYALSSQGRKNLVNRLLSYPDSVSLWNNLHFAVSENDVSLATDLIHRGADVAAADWKGDTALHLAAESWERNISIIKLLLRQPRVNPAVENKKRQTALHLACANGHPEVVRMMLQQPGVSATHTDRIGQTSLHYACSSHRSGRLHIVKLLIDMKVPLDQTCSGGRTPLNLALKRKKFDIVSMLVAEGCDPAGWVASSDFHDMHHVFATLPKMRPSSQTELVQRVVDAGVDVDTPCCFSSLRLETTPVFVAASTLNAACMKVFLQGGAKLNSTVIDWWQRDHYRTRTTFLVGLFCLLFGKPRHRPLVTKNLDKAEEVIVSALEFGATLERLPSPHSDFISALEYGVLVAEDGDTALLELLLKHSTARNARRSFLVRLIGSSGNDSIREMLVDFKARQLSYLTFSSVEEQQHYQRWFT